MKLLRAAMGLTLATVVWTLAPGDVRGARRPVRSVYPPEFRWGNYPDAVRGSLPDYLAKPQDQRRLDPCYTFASVGLVETVNDLLHASADSTGAFLPTDLSELEVFSCGGGISLDEAVSHMSSAGAVATSCGTWLEYPSGACKVAQNQYPNDLIKPISCAGQALGCGERFRPEFVDVTAQMAIDDATIQGILVKQGPIAIRLGDDPYRGGPHGSLLYGWTTEDNELHWLVRDTYPCTPGLFSHPTSLFALPAAFRDPPQAARAYVVTAVHHEVWDSGRNEWHDVTPAPRPFVLPAPYQLVKLTPPPCFHRGEIGVTGLDTLDGTIVNWSLWSDDPPGSVSLTLPTEPGRNPTLSGNAYRARVTATVRRPNGMLEDVTQEMGPVGYAMEVKQTANFCAGTRREISLGGTALTPGVSWSFTFSPSTQGSYYVMGNGSPSPYIVFTSVDSAPYTLIVTGASRGCTATSSGYVMGMPCISYPSSYPPW